MLKDISKPRPPPSKEEYWAIREVKFRAAAKSIKMPLPPLLE